MPIFENVLSRPLLMALMKFFSAYSPVTFSGIKPRRFKSCSVSKARYGLMALAAIANKQRKVHHLARLAAFDDEGHLRARLLAHQTVVYRSHRQQTRDGRVS